jgi:hypothetical protein
VRLTFLTMNPEEETKCRLLAILDLHTLSEKSVFWDSLFSLLRSRTDCNIHGYTLRLIHKSEHVVTCLDRIQISISKPAYGYGPHSAESLYPDLRLSDLTTADQSFHCLFFKSIFVFFVDEIQPRG